MRTEKDILGKLELPKEALYGIHSMRARQNFPYHSLFNISWYKTLGTVKKACYLTIIDYYDQLKKNSLLQKYPYQLIEESVLEAMVSTCEEIESGTYFDHFIVPAISGGAGTSINLNMNEIIANASLLKLGKLPGEYNIIDPIEHANIFQSTNDVIPTSLKVTAIKELMQLEKEINSTRSTIESLEKKYRNTLRIGYTQMQEAVPSSYGRLFGAYNDALSRDWWRVSKCFERIKVVNLGGSAIGSGITVPRYFIMESVKKLQQITGMPVTRAENMHDATSNMDSLVEIHAILKAHAVNLEKITGDLRLLSSDLINRKEVVIPKKQTGSSIMPAKINPVIPEFIISSAHKTYSNDNMISNLCGQGCLDLNAYLPAIGHALLESIQLLTACNITLRENLLEGIIIAGEVSTKKLFESSSITTALLPYIGYNKSAQLAEEMKNTKTDIFEANDNLQLMPRKKLEEILKPENLLMEGFSVKNMLDTDEDN